MVAETITMKSMVESSGARVMMGTRYCEAGPDARVHVLWIELKLNATTKGIHEEHQIKMNSKQALPLGAWATNIHRRFGQRTLGRRKLEKMSPKSKQDNYIIKIISYVQLVNVAGKGRA